jgi:hypothetical protein
MNQILRTPIEDRTEDDLKLLASQLQAVPFFKERGLVEATLLEVVQCMKILEMPKNKLVMEHNEIGENFYFVLQGEVEISIPDPNRKRAFLARLEEINDK